MATALSVRVNYVDPDNSYQVSSSDYITLDLNNDYLIWTAGSSDVKDLMTHEPTSDELNEASTVITDADQDVALCLLMDYSHDVGGAYYTHKVLGMGDNDRYVFCFSFDGSTATEPQLEAWDDDNHSTYAKHVLGNDTPNDSMLKGVCTTDALPGSAWAGSPLAGGTNVLQLNAGNGALGSVPSGQSTQELYANLKITIPASYATPAVESFVLTVRYSWN